jgi:hypothetical protein
VSEEAIWLTRSASIISPRCARPSSALPGGSAPPPRAGRGA